MKIDINANDVNVDTTGLTNPQCRACGEPLNDWGEPHTVHDCIRCLKSLILNLGCKLS